MPLWLSVISYPTHARGIIVKYTSALDLYVIFLMVQAVHTPKLPFTSLSCKEWEEEFCVLNIFLTVSSMEYMMNPLVVSSEMLIQGMVEKYRVYSFGAILAILIPE